MAHELETDRITGGIKMFFHGQLPWHGLGQEFVGDKPATSADAIKLAQMGWGVEKIPLYAKINGEYWAVPSTNAVVRSDSIGIADKEPIILTTNGAAVSDIYTPLQNVDAFNFFDTVVGQGAAMYHTAGALRQGDRIWILAKLPDTVQVLGDDVVDKYLLLVNGHDGRLGVQVMFTPVRVVCNNTLTLATGIAKNNEKGSRLIKIRHTAAVQTQLAEAARLMGIVEEKYRGMGEAFRTFARRPIKDNKELYRYFESLYAPPMPEATDLTKKNHDVRIKKLHELFETGPGTEIAPLRGSLWLAYNAVTDYVDHYGRGKDASTRMDSLLFGHGARIKEQAFQEGIALVN